MGLTAFGVRQHLACMTVVMRIGSCNPVCTIVSSSDQGLTANRRCRDCSAPFAICPYKGKYAVGRSTPDSLASQKLLAGMADRGATSAVIECTSTGIQNGRCVRASIQRLPSATT